MLMLNKTSIVALLAVSLSLSSFVGCSALSEEDKAQARSDSLSLLSSTFQLPVPDDTYSNPNGPAMLSVSGATLGKENVRYLIDNVIDKVGSPFRESKSRFNDVIGNGARSSSNTQLIVKNSTWNAELSLSGDNPATTLQLSYTLAGASYFNGTVSNFATAGSVQAVSGPTQLEWTSTTVKGVTSKVTTITLGSFGKLIFTVTPKSGGNQVDLTGFINNGSMSVTAKWDSTGGSYTVTGGAKTCWNASLQNAACPSL